MNDDEYTYSEPSPGTTKISFKKLRRRTLNQSLNVQQNTFLDLGQIGNCTLCKLSIAALIIASFLVVQPKRITSFKQSESTDSLHSVVTDSLHNSFYRSDL